MEMDDMSSDADTLVDQIERAYAELLRLYRSVPVAALIEPSLSNGWSVKDTLAHIAVWEWRCASLLDAARDTDTPLKAMPDIDALNRESYEERKEWSWTEVEFDFRHAHQTLLKVIRELPFERLSDPFIQQSIAEETWEHYAEHLQDLRQWRQKITSNK